MVACEHAQCCVPTKMGSWLLRAMHVVIQQALTDHDAWSSATKLTAKLVSDAMSHCKSSCNNFFAEHNVVLMHYVRNLTH